MKAKTTAKIILQTFILLIWVGVSVIAAQLIALNQVGVDGIGVAAVHQNILQLVF